MALMTGTHKTMKFLTLLVATLVIPCNFTCNRSEPEPPLSSSGPADGPHLRFAQLSIPESVLTHVAETEGYYTQAGLDYEVISTVDEVDVVAALRSKTRNAAVAGGLPIIPIARMITSGDAPVVIATVVTSRAPAALVTFESTGITQDPNTLRGRRIGVSHDTVCDLYLSRLLDRAALNETDVAVVTGGPVDLQRFLVRGDVDAAVLRDPYANQVERYYYPRYRLKGKVPNRGASQRSEDYTLCTLAFNIVTTRAKLAANRPALVSMLKALIRAEEQIRTHRSETQNELAQWLDVWPRDLGRLLDSEVSQVRVELYPAQIRELLREEFARLKKRDPKTVVPDDVDPFVDASLLSEVEVWRVNR